MKYLDHLLTERDCSVMTFNRPRLTASLYALMSISFWGVSFVSTKAVLGKLDPYSLLVIRFGIGALFLLLLLVLQRHRLHISIKYVPHLMVLGILGICTSGPPGNSIANNQRFCCRMAYFFLPRLYSDPFDSVLA
jgi:hypothetical protein